MKQINRAGISLLLLTALLLGGCAGVHKEYLPPPSMAQSGSELDMDEILVTDPVQLPQLSGEPAMSDNSIWNKSSGIFFRDYRAFEVGDILTVRIFINDRARITSGADRDGSLSGSLSAGIGISSPFYDLPQSNVDAQLGSDVSSRLEGSVNRSENIQLQIAAAVIEASSNGNLKIIGTQEVRVNSELRIMRVEGIVRSKDIAPDNSIPYEKIAEARISYGGSNSRQLERKRFFKPFKPRTIAGNRGF